MGDFKGEMHFTLAAGRRGFIALKEQTDGAGPQMYLGARPVLTPAGSEFARYAVTISVDFHAWAMPQIEFSLLT